MKIFRLLEKILGFLIVAPPVYMLFRYLRWYCKQQHETEEA